MQQKWGYLSGDLSFKQTLYKYSVKIVLYTMVHTWIETMSDPSNKPSISKKAYM